MIKLRRRLTTIEKENFEFVATSKDVAKFLVVEHKHVIRKVQKILSDDFLCYAQHSFCLSKSKKEVEINRKSKRKCKSVFTYKVNVSESYYKLSKEGLLLLLFSFIGKRAYVFKITLIFEGYESALRYFFSGFEKKFKTVDAVDELYVVLFEGGMIKVGKGFRAKDRILQHITNGAFFGKKVLAYHIEEAPKINEKQLVAFCNEYGKLVVGKEYFTAIRYDDVVSFLKGKPNWVNLWITKNKLEFPHKYESGVCKS